MNIIEKYQLTFTKDHKFPSAESKVLPDLGGALVDFRYFLHEILKNTIRYYAIVSSNPTENNHRGMTSDEEHFKYWGELYEINYFGSDAYSLHLYGDKAEISLLSYEGCELPINDLIEILQEWKNFLKVNYDNQFEE